MPTTTTAPIIRPRHRPRDVPVTPTKVRLSDRDRELIAMYADAVAAATGRRPTMALAISQLVRKAMAA